jgi:cell division protein ZapA
MNAYMAEHYLGGVAMLNRMTVTIAGHDYTLLSGDSEAHMQDVAVFVGDKIGEVRGTGAAALESAVLGAMNIADQLFKEREASLGLREQMKVLLEDATKLRAEIRSLKKQITAQEP